jgi:hypothetical protein
LVQYSTWYIFFVFPSDLKLLYSPDQVQENDPNEAKALAILFNRLLLSSTLGTITGIVWVITQRAWHWGFFIIIIAFNLFCCHFI